MELARSGGAVGVCVCVNMGTVPVPGSAGAYTCMDLDRQWGRWGHIVIYRHCDFSFHLSTDRKQSLLFSVAFAPYRLFRLFITKGKAERRGVFRPKGLFASFRGGSAEVV